MKHFVEKTRLEHRVEQYSKDYSFSKDKSSKPVFLNEILSSDLNSKGLSNTFFNPKTPQDNPISIFSPTLEPKPSVLNKKGSGKKALFKTMYSGKNSAKVSERRLSLEPAQKMIRRKSCCCQWCGGISNFEVKHGDILSDLNKFGRQDPQQQKSARERPEKTKVLKKSETIAVGNFNKSKGFERKGPATKDRRGKTMIDMGQPKVRVKGQSMTAVNPATRTSIILEKNERPIKILTRQDKPFGPGECSVSQNLTKALEGSLNLDEELNEESVLVSSDTRKKTLIAARRGSPVTVEHTEKSDLNFSNAGSGDNNITHIKLNPSANSTNTTWSPQSKINAVSVKVVKILKQSTNYIDISPGKLRKQTGPFSILAGNNTLDNTISVQQEYRDDSLSVEKSRDTKILNNISGDSPLKRVEFSPLKNEPTKRPMTSKSISISQSQGNIYEQVLKRVQSKRSRQRSERDKLKTILGMAHVKAVQVYTATQRKDSIVGQRNPTILNRSVFDSNSMMVPHPKFDISKLSFKSFAAKIPKETKETSVRYPEISSHEAKSLIKTKRTAISGGIEVIKGMKRSSSLSALTKVCIVNEGNRPYHLSRARLSEPEIDEKAITKMYLGNNM